MADNSALALRNPVDELVASLIYGILLIAFVVCWYIGSWPFRVAYVAFPCLLFWTWFDFKLLHSNFAFSQLNAMKSIFMLPLLAVATLLLGTVLGVLRRGSDSHAEYAVKRRRLLLWLTGFGLAWVLPYVLLTKAIELGIGGAVNDPMAGFLSTKLLGTPILVLYLVCALSVRWMWRKATRQRSAHLASLEAVAVAD